MLKNTGASYRFISPVKYGESEIESSSQRGRYEAAITGAGNARTLVNRD